MSEKNSEVIENLGGGYRIIQNKEKFCYGTDAAVLADFAVAKPKEKVIDLCSGTGIIPILMCQKTRCLDFTALEIQEEMCDLATRSVLLNQLEERMKVVCGDLKCVKELFPCGSFDVVTCNPPYMKVDSGKRNDHDEKFIARHEVCGDIFDFCACASRLLKHGGKFVCVWRPDRLTDLLNAMHEHRLEPKRMTFVHADAESEPCSVQRREPADDCRQHRYYIAFGLICKYSIVTKNGIYFCEKTYEVEVNVVDTIAPVTTVTPVTPSSSPRTSLVLCSNNTSMLGVLNTRSCIALDARR